MYIQGFVVAVPESNKQAYRDVAAKFADFAKGTLGKLVISLD
jgi:uncharacterized protein YbaA (DUF1428 family)